MTNELESDLAADAERDTFAQMLKRGILDPKYHDVAGGILQQENFTLFVLHSHLLVEKALNRHLAEVGVPEVALGPDGMTFYQKSRAFLQARGVKHTGQNLLTVLNALRNNIAHDFWSEGECVRDAFSRFMPAKKHQQMLEDTVARPLDSTKALFILVSALLGIIVTKDGGIPGASILAPPAAQ